MRRLLFLFVVFAALSAGEALRALRSVVVGRGCRASTVSAAAAAAGAGDASGAAVGADTAAVAVPLLLAADGDSDDNLILRNFQQIQTGGRRRIGIIGTQELRTGHATMIELLSYALVLSGNHVYTSGGGNGTNLAVIKGALRACNPDLLSVILPQSLKKQPPEMQEILSRVANLVEQPQHDNMDFKEAATLCNYKILSDVDQALIFAYHDSSTILRSVDEFEEVLDIIRFYLD